MLNQSVSKLYVDFFPFFQAENFLFEIKDGLLTIYATDLEISLKSSINIVTEENMNIEGLFSGEYDLNSSELDE